jgi:hypothetical protein
LSFKTCNVDRFGLAQLCAICVRTTVVCKHRAFILYAVDKDGIQNQINVTTDDHNHSVAARASGYFSNVSSG